MAGRAVLRQTFNTEYSCFVISLDKPAIAEVSAVILIVLSVVFDLNLSHNAQVLLHKDLEEFLM